jgi:ArsR family transcriptional regulator
MSNEKTFDMELFFAALADNTRLRLLNLMGEDEVCVCFFVEVLGTNQPKISRHLAYLRRAGLVSVRRDWKWSLYRIIKPTHKQAARVFQEIQEWLKDDPEMQREKNQMVEICCAPESKKPVSIQGAPHPAKISSIMEKTLGKSTTKVS